MQYYTARFRYDSVAHWAQRRSRLERLKHLLADIDNASKEWPEEEMKQYQEAVLKVASRICTSDSDVEDDSYRADISVDLGLW